jgi:heat shock protein HslJ
MSVIKTFAVMLSLVGICIFLGCAEQTPTDTDTDAAGASAAAVTASLAPELLDEEWVLQAFGVVGEEDPVVEATRVTLTLNPDGMVRGSTGCNSFSTTYQSDGSATFVLRPLAITRKICPDDILDQEYAVVNAFASVESFDAADEELLLFYQSGDSVLVFRRAMEEPTGD